MESSKTTLGESIDKMIAENFTKTLTPEAKILWEKASVRPAEMPEADWDNFLRGMKFTIGLLSVAANSPSGNASAPKSTLQAVPRPEASADDQVPPKAAAPMNMVRLDTLKHDIICPNCESRLQINRNPTWDGNNKAPTLTVGVLPFCDCTFGLVTQQLIADGWAPRDTIFHDLIQAGWRPPAAAEMQSALARQTPEDDDSSQMTLVLKNAKDEEF